MRKTIASFLLYSLLSAYCGAQTSSTTVSQDLVATAPPAATMLGANFVRTAHHLAWVEKQGDMSVVRVDGKQQGGSYQQVTNLKFSPDESHLVFAARTSAAWWLVYDGNYRPEQYTSVSGIEWQPSSNTLAFTACQGNKKCRLYMEGKATGPEFDQISEVRYSGDGRHMAYIGWRAGNHAIVDGKETGPAVEFLDPRHWGFSLDGRFYMAACRGSHQGVREPFCEHWRYVVDGESGPEFAILSPIEFSADGRHFTYAGVAMTGWAKSKHEGSVVLDGKVLATYPGGKSAPGRAPIDGVLDCFPGLAGISNPLFGPGGKLVYGATRPSGNVAVFVGDEAGQEFEEIVSPIIFSPDGQHFAYVAKQGSQLVEVHDNHPGTTYQTPGRRSCFVDWIYVTNEPRHHLAYEMVCGGTRYWLRLTSRALRHLVVDGKPGPEYNSQTLTGLRYTADWSHFGYEVRGLDGDRVLLNIDGKETQAYNDVVPGSLEFPSNIGTASFIAREGQNLIRVRWPLQ